MPHRFAVNLETGALHNVPGLLDGIGVGTRTRPENYPPSWRPHGGDDPVPPGRRRTGWRVETRNGFGWRVPVTEPAPVVAPVPTIEDRLDAIEARLAKLEEQPAPAPTLGGP